MATIVGTYHMEFDRLSIRDMSFNGQKVLLRVDFNVPLKDGKIIDDTRIKAALPSIRYLIKQGASVILMSHLGDPKGRDEAYSLKSVAKVLTEFLGQQVMFAPDCIGNEVRSCVGSLLGGQVLLLENLRFHKGEKKPQEDPEFAIELRTFGDLYVNDAFGTCHRKHASVYILPQYFPKKSGMGFLIEKEVNFLGKALNKDLKTPFVVLLGGSKITSKIGVINAIMDKSDTILLGGGMGLTFLKAKGHDIGDSLFDAEGLPLALEILEHAKNAGVNVVIPTDVKVARTVDSPMQIVSVEDIPEGMSAFDIGPQTIAEFSKSLMSAGTMFWNGPVGVYEHPPFNEGSFKLAEIIATSDAVSIVGGGDAAAVAKLSGVVDKITHVSTGGGASLEFIEHGTLPGIEVLSLVQS